MGVYVALDLFLLAIDINSYIVFLFHKIKGEKSRARSNVEQHIGTDECT